MITYQILQVLLWVTAIMLFISGIDDLYLDLLYWLQRRKYKKKLPDFSEMFHKPEKPIAIFLGAWKESGVIGRTLTYAMRNQNYSNFRFFVGVYPNDPETIRIVQEISKKDARVIPVINSQNGPTTKADNLNNLFAAINEYERLYGTFEIILVHDAEDFIHPNSLKLYNFLIGYKGYHAIQIPVIPIKSRLGKLFHRTYCDAFAEVHTKDMIVRQSMGTFIPFAGTGMGFHRKTFNYLEKFNSEIAQSPRKRDFKNPFDEEYDYNIPDFSKPEIKKAPVNFSEDDLTFNNDETKRSSIYINQTSYHDDPFSTLNDYTLEGGKRISDSVKGYTFLFVSFVLGWVAFLVYTGNIEAQQHIMADNEFLNKINFSPSDLEAKEIFSNKKNDIKQEIAKTNEIKDGIIKVSNGFSDEKYRVMYRINKNNKISIQESSWGSIEATNNRVEVLKNTGFFKGKDIEIVSTRIDNENIYRVIISEFENVDDARNVVEKIKKPNELN